MRDEFVRASTWNVSSTGLPFIRSSIELHAFFASTESEYDVSSQVCQAIVHTNKMNIYFGRCGERCDCHGQRLEEVFLMQSRLMDSIHYASPHWRKQKESWSWSRMLSGGDPGTRAPPWRLFKTKRTAFNFRASLPKWTRSREWKVYMPRSGQKSERQNIGNERKKNKQSGHFVFSFALMPFNGRNLEFLRACVPPFPDGYGIKIKDLAQIR